MRIRQPLASPLYPTIRFAFTDHPITVWAGVIVLRLYFELMGLRAAVCPLLAPFVKTSHNQIPAVDGLRAWWDGLALGAERVEQFTRYRRDPLLPQLLGLSRVPSPDTLRRVFHGFTYSATHRGLRGADARLAECDAAAPAWAHTGSGLDGLLSIGHPRREVEGAYPDQTWPGLHTIRW